MGQSSVATGIVIEIIGDATNGTIVLSGWNGINFTQDETLDDITGGETWEAVAKPDVFYDEYTWLVNCSGETEKHGLTAEGLKQILPELPALAQVEVCGLMTMAAREGGEAVAAKNFEMLCLLRDEAIQECPSGVSLAELSMGMSHDFEVAIRAGATLVRVGSLLLEGVEAS